MRRIFLINVLSYSSFFAIGILGIGLWWLGAVFSVFLMAAMVWQLGRLREPEWGAMSAIGFALLVCGVAIATDANVFAANDPRPGNYPRQSWLWLALVMLGVVCFVWAVRIWTDFRGWLARCRGALAMCCAILLLLLSNNGSQIELGQRSYGVSSAFYHQAGGKQFGSDLNSASYRLQDLRRNREGFIMLLFISAAILVVASWFQRPMRSLGLRLTTPTKFEKVCPRGI